MYRKWHRFCLFCSSHVHLCVCVRLHAWFTFNAEHPENAIIWMQRSAQFAYASTSILRYSQRSHKSKTIIYYNIHWNNIETQTKMVITCAQSYQMLFVLKWMHFSFGDDTILRSSRDWPYDVRFYLRHTIKYRWKNVWWCVVIFSIRASVYACTYVCVCVSAPLCKWPHSISWTLNDNQQQICEQVNDITLDKLNNIQPIFEIR